MLSELQSEEAPPSVRHWAFNLPDWVAVGSPSKLQPDMLPGLDEGEREAILLAELSKAKLLIIDERRGTNAAHARGLETVGTLGILERAHRRGWIEAQDQFNRLLTSTNFRSTQSLRQRFLDSLAYEKGN